MSEAYVTPAGFMTFGEAMVSLGWSRSKLNRLVREGRLTIHKDPRDARVRLFRAEAIESMRHAQPEAQHQGTTGNLMAARTDRAA